MREREHLDDAINRGGREPTVDREAQYGGGDALGDRELDALERAVRALEMDGRVEVAPGVNTLRPQHVDHRVSSDPELGAVDRDGEVLPCRTVAGVDALHPDAGDRIELVGVSG